MDYGKLFLATGAVAALIGMGWGIQMSATGDHTLSPAHGHLNLLGWVSMAIYGVYYALTPQVGRGWVMGHFGLSLLGLIILVPGIAMAISGSGEALAKVGSVVWVLSMVVFVVTVLRNGVGPARA
ncbi:hypothetical protein [Jannaschia sp. M317]|uniref:hypothetical protein n=1 Tax=Jannaschia sp. M317 TaxID=2867011 RepID=UPI0021A67746|nr:hypothetical protein [Jannaschia sp. M317]UWQ16292.1 hypothetical protein K3551_10165 [Jannaschia sp. M317]